MSKEFQLKDVRIINCSSPIKKWWNYVEKNRNTRLIHAIIDVELSYREYRRLLKLDRKDD